MRKLAVIMFTDMVGYTALMQSNESLAREKRSRLSAVLPGTIRQYNGSVLQYFGDGSLSIFDSAIEACQAAVKIQQQLQQEPKVDLRIGLHSGDVLIEEDSVIGDGVNFASRIESLATPGSVLVSQKIYDEVKNQQEIQCIELGYFELKNIHEPVRVFALAAPGLRIPTRDQIQGKTKPPANRLVVLPFVNMSPDPENEYFSDGITEELLNALTRVNGLQLTSRTSSFAFKGSREDIRQIATKLNVDKVLEGSVRKAGNRVRITAQLINAIDGYHIWSENFDRDLTDIFLVQDEISNIIADKLRRDLNDKPEKQNTATTPLKNLEAYNLFLKGLYYYNKLTPPDTFRAIEYFDQAVAIDPNFARAYALHAGACAYLGVTGQMQTKKAFDIVHRYSAKALSIDPNLAEGYVALGSAYMFYDWKWKSAEDCFRKALELNPASTQSYQLLGFYYVITGDKQKAIGLMEQALVIDPLSPMVNHYLAQMYFANGMFDQSLARTEHLLEMFPNLRISLEQKAWNIGMKGDWLKAKEIFEEVHRLTKHPLKGVTALAFAYGKLGMREEALACIKKMEQREAEDEHAVMDADFAMAWWGLGEKEKSIQYMFQCVEKRLGPVTLYLSSPIFAELTSDPRYYELKRRIGLH